MLMVFRCCGASCLLYPCETIRCDPIINVLPFVHARRARAAQAKNDRPGYPETHIILAETLLKAGNKEEAEKVGRRVLRTASLPYVCFGKYVFFLFFFSFLFPVDDTPRMCQCWMRVRQKSFFL